MENKPLAQLCPHPGPSSAPALRTEVDLPGWSVAESEQVELHPGKPC